MLHLFELKYCKYAVIIDMSDIILFNMSVTHFIVLH